MGKSFTEKLTVAGANLADTVKQILSDPTVERVTIQSKEGKELLAIPVTWGIIGFGAGVILAPILTAVAGIGGAMAELTLEVERREDSEG
ncbi:MAG: DUF4342 domain-containing protein [Propionibacteriaceae bacterium]|nr:DUF4342 domain-containing protein [Propionibacteriaceae bacterium]